MGHDSNKRVAEQKIDPQRLERLFKQNAVEPPRLVVRDEALARLLARAGAGGSY